MEVGAALVAVHEPTHVAEARRRAAELTRRLGFDEVLSGQVAIAVTEAGTNLLKHGSGGDLYLGLVGDGSGRGVQMVAMDRGRGISNLPASLVDGYSTSGTAGTGLGAMRRAATTFDLFTAPSGTIVAATFYPEGTTPIDVGALSIPVQGEWACGDAWTVWSAGELTSVLVVDGLGHGPDAAAAAAAAVATFERHAERPAGQVIELIHGALRTTRGAAVAIAELDHRKGRLRYCGLGNISGVIVGEARQQHLVSVAGIAGHTMRRLQEFQYDWPAGSSLVMHSDGIATHWNLERFQGATSRRVDVLAGLLFRDHRRGRDDATVVVTRNGAAA